MCVCVYVCVLDLPFAQLCHIFFMLKVLWTVVCVTERIVKGFYSPALHHHIQVETEILHSSFCYDKIVLNFM